MRITNGWRAIELIGLIDENVRSIQELSPDSPEWYMMIEVHGKLLVRLLRIILRREPTKEELESITCCDFEESLKQVSSAVSAKVDDQKLDQIIDNLIRRWETE